MTAPRSITNSLNSPGLLITHYSKCHMPAITQIYDFPRRKSGTSRTRIDSNGTSLKGATAAILLVQTRKGSSRDTVRLAQENYRYLLVQADLTRFEHHGTAISTM
jgi:hypothetical protein